MASFKALVQLERFEFHRAIGLCMLFLVSIQSGCGTSPPLTFPVRGKVLWSGKPAAGAAVFFHPVGEKANAESPASERRPAGHVQEDGTFEMSTFGINDGAPPGRYRISIIWTKSVGVSDEATNLLPPRYMNPLTAGLPIVEVREEAMELSPFQLAP